MDIFKKHKSNNELNNISSDCETDNIKHYNNHNCNNTIITTATTASTATDTIYTCTDTHHNGDIECKKVLALIDDINHSDISGLGTLNDYAGLISKINEFNALQDKYKIILDREIQGIEQYANSLHNITNIFEQLGNKLSVKNTINETQMIRFRFALEKINNYTKIINKLKLKMKEFNKKNINDPTQVNVILSKITLLKQKIALISDEINRFTQLPDCHIDNESDNISRDLSFHISKLNNKNKNKNKKHNKKDNKKRNISTTKLNSDIINLKPKVSPIQQLLTNLSQYDLAKYNIDRNTHSNINLQLDNIINKHNHKHNTIDIIIDSPIECSGDNKKNSKKSSKKSSKKTSKKSSKKKKLNEQIMYNMTEVKNAVDALAEQYDVGSSCICQTDEFNEDINEDINDNKIILNNLTDVKNTMDSLVAQYEDISSAVSLEHCKKAKSKKVKSKKIKSKKNNKLNKILVSDLTNIKDTMKTLINLYDNTDNILHIHSR